MKLRFTPTVGCRSIEMEDGSMLYMEHGDEHDFEPELAQKLMLDGTFSVVEDGDWEEELLDDLEASDDFPVEDGPAAKLKFED